MADTDDYEILSRVTSEGYIEWAKRRAGKKSISKETDARLDYTPIVFPDPADCRHAALVVCGAMVGEEDPVAAAREILEALALPKIMREGGDGRTMKTQVRQIRRRGEPLPIGFGEEYGRPDARVTRNRKKNDSAEVLREGL